MQGTIVQIIAADSNYFILEEVLQGYSREKKTSKYRVVAWALVELNGTTAVLPMILKVTGLGFMSIDSNYRIERQA